MEFSLELNNLVMQCFDCVMNSQTFLKPTTSIESDTEWNNDPPLTRYNLRSCANLVNSQINPNIIPCIDVFKPAHRYARGLAAANNALQMSTLCTTLQKHFPSENVVCAILDEETGKSLEFRQIIKLDKYQEIWMKSFANKLGRLAQGI